MVSRKGTTKRKSITSLNNRIKKWNAEKAKLTKEALAIQKEANKHGFSVKLSKK